MRPELARVLWAFAALAVFVLKQQRLGFVLMLLAVLTCGALMGFVGSLPAVPCAAVLLVLLRQAKARYLSSRFYCA
jgi:predicted PurR-regulated permease PerM